MTIIQAYKRTKSYTHEFADITIKFEPNAIGDVVADVELQSAVDRLLQVPTGFRVYQYQPGTVTAPDALASVLLGAESTLEALEDAAESVPLVLMKPAEVSTLTPQAPDESPFVLKDEAGEVILDLRKLDDESLHEFAKQNAIKVHHAAKGDTIRSKIVEALSAPPEAAAPAAPAAQE